MKYGYVRVSTKEQNIDRQLVEMYAQGLNDKTIFIDKQSGKDFERDKYQKLKGKLKSGDLLIIKSIDRLGRNYDMIIDEWRTLVNDMNVDILSFVAENERENIKKRQAEGIRIAKEKGKHLGRPKLKLPKNFTIIANQYKKKEITLAEALSSLKMNRSTFYKNLSIFY